MELLKSLVWRDVYELDSDKIGGQFQSHLGFGWFFSWFWQCQLCPRKRQLCSDESHELSQFRLLWMNPKVDDCVDYNAKYMHGNWEFCKINRVEGPLVKLWIQNKRSYQIRLVCARYASRRFHGQIIIFSVKLSKSTRLFWLCMGDEIGRDI